VHSLQDEVIAFSIDLTVPAALRLWIDTAFNRNEYQNLGGGKGRSVGRRVSLTSPSSLIHKGLMGVRSEVFTAVTMKNDVFWNVIQCGS
jgi:hypothetical protein